MKQMYVVYVGKKRVLSERKLKKKFYNSKNNDFKNALTFEQWLEVCIDRGFIGYAN